MIIFRVDANEQIATGHLMRCLAIAAECRRRGKTCLFLLAEEKQTQRITERGFSYQILHSAWDCLEQEIELIQEFLHHHPCEWLVVDTYQATPRYLQRLNEVCPVLYLDDFGKDEYQVAAVLHYGLIQDQETYIQRYQAKGVSVLAGAKYIPLREEFQPAHLKKLWIEQAEPQSAREQENILITTGGTDPYHVTDRLLEYCLAEKSPGKCCFHVIVGSMNEQISDLRQLAERAKQEESVEVKLYFGVSRMAELMCRCDYAVSAGGTTLYELCACGVPTVCFTFADNQMPAVQMLAQQQIMRYAGDARAGDLSANIFVQLAEYRKQPEETGQYQERMKELVDGRGVCRIADVLSQKSF